ncbi:MAG: c-type cytochrome [Planctomycetales bacterium]
MFECLTRHPVTTADPVLAESFEHGLGSESRFVGQTAAHALRAAPEEMLQAIGVLVRKSSWQTALMFAYAQYLRQQYLQPGVNAYAVEMGRRVLEGQHPAAVKLQAVRLIQLGLGDLGMYDNLAAVTRGYTSPYDLRGFERELDPVRVTLGQIFPTGDKLLDQELARTAAVLGLLNPKFLDQVLKQITSETSPTDDIHYLVVAGRLPVPRNIAARQATAAALVNIDPKITARKMALDSNWSDRITEMFNQLVDLDPELPDEILKQKNFGTPGHILLLGKTPPDKLPQAIAKFTAQAKANEDYTWTNDVVFLIGSVDSPENRAQLRTLYDNLAVRNAALISLGNRPEAADREKFVEGLDSAQLEVLTASLGALEKLPASGDAAENVMLVRTLRRLGTDKSEFPLRDRVVQLLERNTGKQFPYYPGPQGAVPQPEAVKAWTDWAMEAFPQQAASGLSGGSEADVKEVKRLLAVVPWEMGNAERGRKVFETRACHQCHMGQRALGPDLAGVTGRFSREDLLNAIILPNRDVSSRYHTTMIETAQGKVYSGLIVYESVDGILMRNSTNQTFRFEANEITARRKLSTSLMPTGLLKDATPEQVADLVAYLHTLKPKPMAQLPPPDQN